MKIHVCDKCLKQSDASKENNVPKGWRTIRFHISYSDGNVEYLLCPDCLIALNIPETTDYSNQSRHIGDRLLEIIEEIVQNAIEPS